MSFTILRSGAKRFNRLFAIVLLSMAVGCASTVPALFAFYDSPVSDSIREPGRILRIEPFPGAPQGATAWRILYRSNDLDGAPLVVSGVVIAPTGPAPREGRKIVAWAHPTTGVGDRCAPSLVGSSFFSRIPGLETFLERGHVVAVTDYEGLGTPGPHPYLVGESEGRSVLDIVRAARRIAEARAGNTFAVWGHSQGGHAAFFTGQIAASYAPELDLKGIAVAAPATDLALLLEDDFSSRAGKILTAFSLWSWHKVYGASLDKIVDPDVRAGVERVAESCIQRKAELLVVAYRQHPINHEFLNGDLVDYPEWSALLARNTPGGAPAGAPVFIAQGTEDSIVNPNITLEFARRLCSNATPVDFDLQFGATHSQIARKSASAAADWIEARFDGEPPENDCPYLPFESAAADES